MHERSRRQPLDSIATKLIFFVFFSTFCTLLLLSWTSIHSTYAAQKQRIDQQLPAAAARAREQFEAWIAIPREALQALGATAGVPSEASLERARVILGRFAGLTLVSHRGEVRAAAGRPLPAGAPPTSGNSRALRAISGAGGGRAIALTVPWGQSDERLIGILSSAEIAEFVNQIEVGSGIRALLVDAAGHVLFGPGSPKAIRALESPGIDEPRAVNAYTNDAGTVVLTSALPVRFSDWSLVVEAPFEALFAPVLSLGKRILVLAVWILLIVSFLAYKITTSILRPIEVLSDGARRIAHGQLDHEIPEPATQDEIGLLARTFNDMLRELRGNHTEIESANAELREKNLQFQRANEVLEQLSITDGLTKLHNHRFFQDHLTREIKRADRVPEPLSMILVDVDDFKSLNDHLGHAAGDELLRRVASLMNDSIRESDLLARYGGDEFVIVTSNTDLAGAQSVAEKIRTNVAESSFIIDESLRPTRATLSMGVAQYRGTRKQFFAAADQALYRAKARGKNCVVIDDEDGG